MEYQWAQHDVFMHTVWYDIMYMFIMTQYFLLATDANRGKQAFNQSNNIQDN